MAFLGHASQSPELVCEYAPDRNRTYNLGFRKPSSYPLNDRGKKKFSIFNSNVINIAKFLLVDNIIYCYNKIYAREIAHC